jgi:hypothetical protein
MDNSMAGGAAAAVSRPKSAVQRSSAAIKIKLALLWLAVSLPLIWGAMKALENIGSLPL